MLEKTLLYEIHIICRYFYKDGVYKGKPHQYNCTYFSALKKMPQDYLLARAIQFFTPGMPMVSMLSLFEEAVYTHLSGPLGPLAS
jgi:hypothetical protein